jgi:uncharacterized membrane protein
MPAKTPRGAEAAARWKAFKAYLERIEKLTDLKQSAELFERYLPYAIAFGMNKSWIWKFSTLTDTPAPAWYVPYGVWLPGHLGRPGRGALASPTRADPSAAPTASGGLQGMSDGLAGGLQSMGDGLTQLLNTTGRVLQTAPSSSGRSGGGGFSGGGFSGGGGGGGGGRGFG